MDGDTMETKIRAAPRLSKQRRRAGGQDRRGEGMGTFTAVQMASPLPP